MNTPVQVMTNVVAVAAGQSDTLFVKGDGTLWGMGSNNYGGAWAVTGRPRRRTLPVLIATNVVAVAEVDTRDSLFIKGGRELVVDGGGRLGVSWATGAPLRSTPRL